MELKKKYDSARNKGVSQFSESIVCETEKEGAESNNSAIQQGNSSANAPHIPKLLWRSLVVCALLIAVGAVMSGAFSNKGGDAVIGLGLMGLAFLSLPSFVWWVAKGGIEDALLGKLLRYSFYVIPLLFILGGVAGSFFKKQDSGGIGIISVGIIVALMVFIAVFVAWLARKGYLFFSSEKSPMPKSNAQGRSAGENGQDRSEGGSESGGDANAESNTTAARIEKMVLPFSGEKMRGYIVTGKQIP